MKDYATQRLATIRCLTGARSTPLKFDFMKFSVIFHSGRDAVHHPIACTQMKFKVLSVWDLFDYRRASVDTAAGAGAGAACNEVISLDSVLARRQHGRCSSIWVLYRLKTSCEQEEMVLLVLLELTATS